MSSYSDTSLSSYDPASSSSSECSSTPSTSPGTSPSSPSFPHGPLIWKSPPNTRFVASPPQAHPQAARRNSRALALDMRPHGIGIDPSTLVGKQLIAVRRSHTHPCTKLQFSDGTAYQILVLGYDPHYPGLPKVLESDSSILNPQGLNGSADVRLTISHAALITLSDKAFQIHNRPEASASMKASSSPKEDRWTQRHAAFALKFEEDQRWHCVSAVMVEHDEKDKQKCIFRNYADVYVDALSTTTPPLPSAPVRATSHTQPPSPGIGQQKGDQKSKRRGGRKRAGAKPRW